MTRELGRGEAPPRCLTRLVQALKSLAILDGVHGAEKPLVRVGDELTIRDQTRERLFHQLVPGLDPVQNFSFQHEEAAVDPEVGAAHVLDCEDIAIPISRHDVGVELRRDREEHRCLPTLLERLDDVRQRRVGETVSVRREERLIVAEVGRDGLEPFADRRVEPGVGERDAPFVEVARQELEFGVVRVALQDEVVEQGAIVRKEVLLDDLALVTETENELVVAPHRVVAHDVPQDRPAADLDHRLRNALGLLTHADAVPPTEDHDLHETS